ncbi:MULTISPECIES: ATP-binding protein [Bifidobacterium]|uniref:ATP-binding protein n=1 Tax=Bifidobacterium TaxID=1678 RepID=UPI001BDC168A|nr:MULTISPECIES: ATP-binding protein [Bifidobacterium]MBT1161370.1 ATP-binding protein [Bifidobacterium sp. SO1]MBW3079729.1 ATP-binding protein [Bifidobacterium simiiventris]
MKESRPLIDRPRYLDRIMPFIGADDVIKVLVGLRRSGKSDMLRLIQQRLISEGRTPDQFISLNFEDYSLTKYHDPDALYPYLMSRINAVDGTPYVFLDEVQEVRGFEKVVNSLRATTKADVTITGSNSTLLSGELATYLGGRYVQFEIFPFGYAEFRDARQRIHGDDSFNAFLMEGGMPFVAAGSWDEESRRTYLTDIYRSVVLRDVVRRHRIRDVALLERIVMFAMQNTGNVLSANAIAAYLKAERIDAGTQTVINYLEYCREAFLLERMNRTDLVGKQVLKTLQKYYVADHGLRNAIIGDGTAQIQGVLENMVAVEGLRRGYTVSVGTVNGKEVDFVFDKGSQRRYVQVTYLIDSDKTAEREFGVFTDVPDNYPKTVVSMDPILRPRDGIEHRRIDEFLLAEDW